jgi:hypothetical protein
MRTAAVLGLLALTACASSNSATVSSEEHTVRVMGGAERGTAIMTTATHRPRIASLDTPMEEVWRALPAAYAAVGIEVARTDVNRGVIGNPGFRARRRLGDTALSRYLDCGATQGNPSADTYEVHFSVMTEVTRGDRGATIVTTLVDATARAINFPGDPVRCSSKGELENRIVAVVREVTG